MQAASARASERRSIDPPTLAVLKGRLEEVAAEMDATLVRSAFNPIIAEAHDCAHGLYDAETGETLSPLAALERVWAIVCQVPLRSFWMSTRAPSVAGVMLPLKRTVTL